jgi:DNA-binding NarL/FixJ family response regulator
MSDLQNHVLVVDDEFLIAETLRCYIEDFGLKVCGTASTAENALALAQEHRPAIVLMDMRLSGKKDGVDAALAINATLDSKIIFITGSSEPTTMARIGLGHPFAVLFKPISGRELRASIAAAIKG